MIKANNNGTMLKFSTRLSSCNLLSVDAVATYFCSSRANKIRMAINAKDLEIAGVVRIETVVVVTNELNPSRTSIRNQA
jgi:hypothetical protein